MCWCDWKTQFKTLDLRSFPCKVEYQVLQNFESSTVFIFNYVDIRIVKNDKYALVWCVGEGRGPACTGVQRYLTAIWEVPSHEYIYLEYSSHSETWFFHTNSFFLHARFFILYISELSKNCPFQDLDMDLSWFRMCSHNYFWFQQTNVNLQQTPFANCWDCCIDVKMAMWTFWNQICNEENVCYKFLCSCHLLDFMFMFKFSVRKFHKIQH